MTKRLLIALLTLSVLFSGMVKVSAEDIYSGSGSSVINGHIYSTYTVEIPAVMNISQWGDVPIKISNAALEEGCSVYVYCTNFENGYITMSNTNNGSMAYCDITNTDGVLVHDSSTQIARFQTADLVDGESEKYIHMSMLSGSMPGDYTGTMQYTFICKN